MAQQIRYFINNVLQDNAPLPNPNEIILINKNPPIGYTSDAVKQANGLWEVLTEIPAVQERTDAYDAWVLANPYVLTDNGITLTDDGEPLTDARS